MPWQREQFELPSKARKLRVRGYQRGAQAMLDWHKRVVASPFGSPDVKKLIGYGTILDIEKRFLTKDAQRDYKSTRGHRTNFADTGMIKRKGSKSSTPKGEIL